MANELILAVDDEAHILELLSFNLEASGYRVVTAATGEDALVVCAHERPAMVLLDIMLPGPCDDGLVAVLTAYLDVGEPLWNDKFLLVDAFLDIDDLVVLHKGTADLNGFTYVTEFGSTVTCHKESVGIVIAFTCSKSSEK